MKQIWTLVALCLMLCLLLGCAAAPQTNEEAAEQPAVNETAGQSEPEQQPQTEPAQPVVPEQSEAEAETEAELETTEPEQTQPEQPEGPTLEDALGFVDQDVSALIEALGEPISRSYEASCMADGDDGILEYDGFIVFTFREPDGSAETVMDAE